MTSHDPHMIEQIRSLKPWHHNIQLTDDLSIMDAFSPEEQQRKNNDNVSMVDLHDSFTNKVHLMYPDGLSGKRFLDCACNGGGYCFWASEIGAEQVYGFDVREHWINQAKFVQQHRTVGPVDNIQFAVSDLMDLPNSDLQAADFTLFKGIFYHLADPILGLKIAAELTNEVIWVNTARCFIDNQDCLMSVFESDERLMSGVHSLSWIPSGPRVIAKLLYWLGFQEICHVFSKQYDHRPQFGRMELIASRKAGMLDRLAEEDGACMMDVQSWGNSQMATDDIKSLF